MTTTATHWTDDLTRLLACNDAVAWAKGYDSLDAAWAACERGDWMLWLADRVSGEPGSPLRRKLVLAACDCAELSLPIFEKKSPGDKRPRTAIETARRYANGEAGVTLEDVANAADAAAYAAAEAAVDAAREAACAAYMATTYATCAAYAAADAAAYAAYAAREAARAAYAAHATTYATCAAAHAAEATLRQCAKIVRKHYPQPPTMNGDDQ
jgi:hypothetical protein